MRITNELRNCIKLLDVTNVHHSELFDIADRIDVEHQKTIRELNNFAEASVLLPVDADGVPIHIGDEVYARRKDATYGNHYYFNGTVESIEFEKEGTYAYVRADDDDGDQFNTCELHHGRHIHTAGQILEDLVNDVFNLVVVSERSKEINSITTWNARIELVKQYIELLRPLLSYDAEV